MATSLQKLEADLLACVSEFANAPRPRTVAQKRKMAVSAALAARAFVIAQGWSGLGEPFGKIARALVEVERGRSVDWLTPIRKGRPPSGLTVKQQQLQAAVRMQLLMDSGSSREDAARKIFRSLPNNGSIFGSRNRSATWRTVDRWRQDHSGTPAFKVALAQKRG